MSVSVSLADVDLRLENGGQRCEGRVEVKYQGVWGTVHDHDWNLEDAAVVCRQLECGVAIDVPRGFYFGSQDGPIWHSYLFCKGTEFKINDCIRSAVQKYHEMDYSHNWDVGVVCSGKVCLVWQGIPSSNSLSLILRITENTGSQPLEHTWVKTPVTQ